MESLTARRSRYATRAREYASLFRRSMHVKYGLANLLCGLLPDIASGVIRARLYKWAGFDVHREAFIMGNLTLTGASPGFYDKLVIGEGAIIADHVTINLDEKVTIGRNVGIAPHVVVYTGSHKIGPGSRRLGKVGAEPVVIEDGAWIRIGAIVVPGITVGRGSIVASGAVVLKDVPPNTYVEGNPAQVIRTLGWADR